MCWCTGSRLNKLQWRAGYQVFLVGDERNCGFTFSTETKARRPFTLCLGPLRGLETQV